MDDEAVNVLFSPAGALVAAASRAGIRAWDTRPITVGNAIGFPNGQEDSRFHTISQPVTTFAFANETELLLIGGDGELSTWGLNEHDLLWRATSAASRPLENIDCQMRFGQLCDDPAIAIRSLLNAIRLGRAGKLEESEQQFARAGTLGVSGKLGEAPRTLARRARIDALADRGAGLLRAGEINAAFAVYEDIRVLANGQVVSPAIVRPLLGEVERLARAGDVASTEKASRLARVLNPGAADQSKISAQILNNLCWYATLDYHEGPAMKYCEEAVQLSHGQKSYVDSRGLAFMCLGDFKEATRDFKDFLTWTKDPVDIEERNHWIAAMARGENPCTPDLRARLKAQ
jgi:hypothetical protein